MLAHRLLSLPPILHKLFPNPLPSCSKGSRGLSVLLRVNGIFTAISISLRTTLRLRPDRCAIRAGRNLPDKEFRYLRTVIVTAAVYRGFSSELPPPLNGSVSPSMILFIRCLLVLPSFLSIRSLAHAAFSPKYTSWIGFWKYCVFPLLHCG